MKRRDKQFSSVKMLLLSILLTFCVLGNPSFCDEDVGACPDGDWKDAGFLGLGCLLWSSQHTHSWEAANEFCFERNSSLVEIETEQQWDYLVSEITDFIGNAAFSRDWWTSGSDWGREGRWYWTSSLNPVPDFVWKSGQPDGGLDENCLLIKVNLGEVDMAQDDSCDSYGYHICQIK